MWYLSNKYAKVYFAIVSFARSRVHLPRFETHHIQPRSLGGSNDESNLIKLTLREHFICHRLLARMTEGESKSKMVYAVYRMQHHARYNDSKITYSRSYEALREQFVADRKRYHAENQPAITAKLIATLSTPESHAKKVEAALRASTPEVNAKKSASAKKRVWSDEVKKKMSDSRKALYADTVKREQAIERSKATKIANGTTEKEVAKRQT